MTKISGAPFERNIARSRIVLSLVAIASVYIDPTMPKLTRWVELGGGPFAIDPLALAVMGLHLLYATSLYIAVSARPVPGVRLAAVATWADVLFAVAVAVVTEGATSPAYVFFAFAILAVGCRATLAFTLKVTVVCVALYLGVIVMSADRGTAKTYLMRPAYLAITGYLIAFLAQQRLSLEAHARELESQAERQSIARSLHDGYVQALAGVNLRLESCRELLRRGRHDDAVVELMELQGSVRREYDEVRVFLRSLVDPKRQTTAPGDTTGARFTVRAEFAGSGVLVEHVLHIMLEGIRNVRRHAAAGAAEIGVRSVDRRVHVTIDDDGVGFAPGAQPPWAIASRVIECGGTVRIVEAERGGHLEIEIPERESE